LAVPLVPGWAGSLATRWVFVLTLRYLFNYLPLPLNVGLAIGRLWAAANPFFNRHFPLIPTPIEQDALYQAVFALVIAVVWFLFDRRRKHEAVLQEVTRVVCRYTMAGMAIYYGMEKIIGAQGHWALEPFQLSRSYGHLEPCARMFGWLTYSTVYAQFAGWVEASAGLLLFWRRTTTLGAMLAFAFLANVFMVNITYCGAGWGPAPGHMMPAAAFLLLPHLDRFSRFLVRNQPTAPPMIAYLTPPSWFYRIGAAIKVVMASWIVYKETVPSVWEGIYASTASPLRGVYRVEEFERNNVREPLAPEFPERWRELSIDQFASSLFARTVGNAEQTINVAWPPSGFVEKNDGNLRPRAQDAIARAAYTAAPQGDLAVVKVEGTFDGVEFHPKYTSRGTLHYNRTAPDRLTLEGSVDGTALKLRLRRLPTDSLPFFRYRWKPI
jgi:hypothetical protein